MHPLFGSLNHDFIQLECTLTIHPHVNLHEETDVSFERQIEHSSSIVGTDAAISIGGVVEMSSNLSAHAIFLCGT